MPTIGWILEDAVERFWEGQPRIAAASVSLPVFVCSRCGRKLASPEELRRHFSLDHPLELPVLYVRGEPLLRESIIRVPLGVSDVEMVQCSRCEVQMDGSPWRRLAMPEFRKEFTRPVDATWNVRLVHARALDDAEAAEEYHVRFRVPDLTTLNAVDERFLQTLVLDEVRHTDLELFETGLPAGAPVREYSGALGNYTLGILLKERRSAPHAPVPFERFAELMKEALEVLRLFPRPVALAVCSSIRFNLNDFAEHGAGGAAEIETGLRFFRRITSPGASTKKAGGKERPPKAWSKPAVCPVDQVTHRLLAACASLEGDGQLSLAELEALRQLTRGTVPVSEQDLAKVHIICAEGYLRLGRAPDALPHLRAIQFVRPFNDWAQQQLNPDSTNGT